jgi:hypothetical protein
MIDTCFCLQMYVANGLSVNDVMLLQAFIRYENYSSRLAGEATTSR